MIQRAKKRAFNNNREALLEPSTLKPPLDRLTLVTTFNTFSNGLKKIIKTNWKMLNMGQERIPVPLFSFKRSSSLRDRLVHTRPRSKEKRGVGTLWNLPAVKGHYPCGSCSVCEQTKHSTSLDILPRPWSQEAFTNCNSDRVIYLITCPCSLHYVGMTTRKVKLRIQEHKSTFRCQKTNTGLTKHFVEQKHTHHEFSWTVLEKPLIPGHIKDISRFLFTKEQKWVFRLKSDSLGLNDAIPWVAL